ncbi:MAG: reverse transcriptase/maturase family protein [bacterium]
MMAPPAPLKFPDCVHPLFDLKNIYRAYRKCRKRKRKTYNAMLFEQDLEENLLDLYTRLNRGVYCPASSQAFMVEKPKRREIFAAAFKDRVVHHLLVTHLEPSWERRFIFDSYACRKGKGTHRGVKRLKSFMLKVTTNKVRPAWYLQLDVRGFFITLDKHILYRRLVAHELNPVVQQLMRVIIFNDPTKDCRFRDVKREDFESLPPHKTLFRSRPDCGLPIGNLTSQFFANVYLDALDQFVKHTLRVRFYLRYCDDMVLLSQSRAELEHWEHEIEMFLKGHLHLELNERKKLRPVSDGVDFLGYIVRPDYLLVRRRVVNSMKGCLRKKEEILLKSGMKVCPQGCALFPWPRLVIEKTYASLSSYLGHLQWASSYRLTAGLCKNFPWLRHYFLNQEGKIKLQKQTPRYAVSLFGQKRWFRKQLKGDILIIQRGRVWEVMADRTNINRLRLGASRVFSRSAPDTCGLDTGGEQNGKNVYNKTLGDKPLFFPCQYIHNIVNALLKGRFSVAWIAETGMRLGPIAERALMCRSLFINEAIIKGHPGRKNTINLRHSSEEINFITKTLNAILAKRLL